MSVRLSIVLSQSSGGGSATSELEGQLVAELIGAAGMDLSIVGPLQRMADSQTDRLVLEGLQSDFALMTWLPTDEIEQNCQTLGIQGARSPHALDPACERTSESRRIYMVSLLDQSLDAVLQTLRQILEARRTATVSLGPPVSAETPSRPPSPTPQPPRAIQPATPPSEVSDAFPTEDDHSLDSLVDDLNDSGI